MLDISIRELNEIVGGQLRFGSMPPLGGALETIGRVIPDETEIQKRDVVVFAGDEEPSDFFAEAAFAKGALGVIANRFVAAWDGTFVIRVPIVKAGLIRLADWCYRRFGGVRVAVVACDGDATVAASIRQQTLGLNEPLPSDLAWQLIQLITDHSHAVTNFTPAGTCRESLTICEPDVIVFADRQQPNEKLAEKMIRSINRNGTVILPYHDEHLWQLAVQRGSEIIVVDDGPRLDGDTQNEQLVKRTIANIQQRLAAIAQAEKERQIKAELARAKAQERKRA